MKKKKLLISSLAIYQLFPRCVNIYKKSWYAIKAQVWIKGLAIDTRRSVLVSFGASESEIDELLSYNKNHFNWQKLPEKVKFPLESEPFLEVWEDYCKKSKKIGVFNALKIPIIQLWFPIREGTSKEDYYRMVTRRGVHPSKVKEATGIELEHPESIQLLIHPTPAGKIPIIVTRGRKDFVTFIQAIIGKNEPISVPESMGAIMIAGYNNWDRIRRYRRNWEENFEGKDIEEAWREEFRRLIPRKELYQDKFIILSDGAYSGIPAEVMGMKEDDWRELSTVIRREHECAHYFTRRVFSSMKNRLLDELIADFMGIREAVGCFRADWFLRFMGLENYPEYREGGRLENYRENLSDGAFRILQKIAKKAAENLEVFDSEHGRELHNLKGKTLLLLTLTKFTPEELASDRAVSDLKRELDNAKKVVEKS